MRRWSEMGMNHPGEIAYLARIGRPTVALVTNAQRAHLEGMGTLETIATEKGSIFSGLDRDGVAVFNAGDPWADLWRSQSAHCRRLCFALDGPAEVSGHCQTRGLQNRVTIVFDGQQIEVGLALPGTHNARNALGAAATALAAGVALETVRDGLAAFRGLKGRLQRLAGQHGAMVLDDTYNANPDSVRAGIDVLASTVGRKILVLGDMGEIGRDDRPISRRSGRLCQEPGHRPAVSRSANRALWRRRISVPAGSIFARSKICSPRWSAN